MRGLPGVKSPENLKKAMYMPINNPIARVKRPIKPNIIIGFSKAEKTRWDIAVFLNLNFDFPLFRLDNIAGVSLTRYPRANALERISRWISFPSDSSSREQITF